MLLFLLLQRKMLLKFRMPFTDQSFNIMQKLRHHLKQCHMMNNFSFIFHNHILKYSIAQFKLDKTCVQHGLNATRFSFHTCASMHVHTRLMTSNLPCIALVYTLDVCTTVCKCMRACQECTSKIWIMLACKL